MVIFLVVGVLICVLYPPRIRAGSYLIKSYVVPTVSEQIKHPIDSGLVPILLCCHFTVSSGLEVQEPSGTRCSDSGVRCESECSLAVLKVAFDDSSHDAGAELGGDDEHSGEL